MKVLGRANSIRSLGVPRVGASMLCICYIALITRPPAYAESYDIVVPDIPGIEVQVGKSVSIPSHRTALAFMFADGRIVVGSGEDSFWSLDGGNTFERGPQGPGRKVAIDLGNEILAVGRNTKARPDGMFTADLLRSFDNWRTAEIEEAVVEIPNASYTVTGSGGRVDGFLFHHGILELPNGDLIATMYGNYMGDTILCDGYPPALNQRKYRTIVVFSKDGGRTWGDHVLVAYDTMLGRGIPEDHLQVGLSIPPGRVSPTTIVPAITQEGFREADLTLAPNGDLICVMRSGGRNEGAATLFPTPLYCSRSSDGGRNWTPPAQIADRGVCPNLVTMSNGIIVCTYSRPGNWLIFSDDNGRTWKGAFQFGVTGAYNYLLEVAPDTIQVYHEVDEEKVRNVRATFFKVRKSTNGS